MAPEDSAPAAGSASLPSAPPGEPRASGKGRRRRRRNGDSGSSARTVLRWLAAVVMGVCLIGAPLACGAVHRPIIFIVTGLAAVLALLTAGLAFRNQAALKPAIVMVFPILFLVITALQIIPLPWGLRARLDPAGTELLSLAGLAGPQPFSLDPPATYLRLAEAAAALIVGSAAMVLTASRRLRYAAMGLVALNMYSGLRSP